MTTPKAVHRPPSTFHLPPSARPVQLGVRVPPELLAALKARHRRTYAEHGLSFNRWICVLLEDAAYP